MYFQQTNNDKFWTNNCRNSFSSSTKVFNIFLDCGRNSGDYRYLSFYQRQDSKTKSEKMKIRVYPPIVAILYLIVSLILNYFLSGMKIIPSPYNYFGIVIIAGSLIFMILAFKAFKKRIDYAEYGGAPLLGIKGAGMICHGGSNAKAIMNAVNMASQAVQHEVHQKLATKLHVASS